MASRPSLTISLPRNFSFHYTDGEEPTTPAPAPAVETTEPPPPPRQTFKVRRRRADNGRDNDHALPENESAILPRFKMTEADETSPQLAPAVAPGYLAPEPSFLPLLSPPRTPVSQIGSYGLSDKDASEWSLITNSHDLMARPLSACSSFSDSSASSGGSSMNSYPSLGGSLTSPESEPTDPFSFDDTKIDQPIFSPELVEGQSPLAKRHKTTRHPKWTPEMDSHLWLTYIVYVQDPRVTPFKMLPGTAPPLGVCHRVAREAKHLWKGHRAASLSMPESGPRRASVGRTGSPDTIRPSDAGNRTPVAADFSNKAPSKWPRSEAATRRRLRELCKKKPSLSAHYQRLLQRRSPSPLQSSSPRSRSDPESVSFSSRSMNVSLAAATASSMQADAPLAQLTSDAPAQQVQREPISTPAHRPDGWFARIGRSQAHQKSQSLQLGLGLGYGYGSGSQNTGQLDSPFDGDSGFDRNRFLNSMNATKSLGRNFSTKVEEPSLNSPLELHAPVPTARSLKRRFRLDDDTAAPSHNALQSLFENATVDTTSRATPARERAFSLGAMGDGTRSLGSFFSRQQGPDMTMTDVADLPINNGFLHAPEPTLRLGSPFGGATSTHFNTFPRRFVPLGSDTPDQTFEERFRQLAGQHQ